MRRIINLSLTDYRCYSQYLVSFGDKVNVIVGGNAVGKTSLVEAIYCLGLGKSFKTRNDKELIRHNSLFCIIKGTFEPNGDEVSLVVTENGKKLKKNSIEYKQLSEHLGFFNVVMFTPEDLDLIKGGPNQRRSFLDINLAQFNKVYLDNLISYKKLLKQRNEVLKDLKAKYDLAYLEAITESLIAKAIKIVEIRNQFLNDLMPLANKNLGILSNGEETLEIVYKPSCNVDKMWKTFKDRQDYDILIETTTVGPHRDDFQVLINGDLVNLYGSQGQQRSASLAIKLGFAEMLNKITNSVIIILDDVFSELDDNRQNKIFDLVKNYNQIFITTTSIDSINDDILNDCKIIEL